MKNNRYNILAIMSIILITGLSYYPVLFNDFTNWDDDLYVSENQLIMTLSPENIKRIFITPVACIYHPLTILSYALEYSLFQLNPFIYHLTNITFHIFNTLLVFYLIFLLTQSVLPSFITALFFGIHPLHVESVAWISERKDVLSTFFFLLSIIFYVYYKERGSMKYYYISLFIFLFSLLSKPMTITLPLILILIDYTLNQKFKIKFFEKIPYFILSIIFAITAIITQKSGGGIQDIPSFTFFDNIFIASYGLIFYLVKVILPVNLSAIYPYPTKVNGLLPLPFLFAPILVISLFIFIIYYRYTKHIFFGFTFFIITILPVIKFIPLGYVIAADRYTYIPLIGVFYTLGIFFNWLYYSKKMKFFTTVVLIIICFIMSVLSWERCKVWENNITLWTDAIIKYPDTSVPYNNRGLAYTKLKQYNKALKDFNEAIYLNPGNSLAYNNRGLVYTELKQYNKALEDFTQAINYNSLYSEAYLNKGNIYYRTGKYEEAILQYNIALKLNKNLIKCYINIGNSYSALGKRSEALETYNKVIDIEPMNYEAYTNRGTLYGEEKKYDKAINDFTVALNINPNYYEALYNRALTYYITKNYNKSLEDINKLKSMGCKVNFENIKY